MNIFMNSPKDKHKLINEIVYKNLTNSLSLYVNRLTMKIFLNLVLFINLFLINKVNSWRIFNKGRMYGGNIGLPPITNYQDNNTIQEIWYNQLLDHFNPTDKRTWQQRYYTNDIYYKKGGPVFLLIGGEGEASIKWMSQGAWIDYGKKYGAFLFQLEHRYYGKSHPTSNLSTDNLRYLSSEQALADLARFIDSMNKKYNFPLNVKWIAFGGSYPGSLAAWLRYKYPHLVHGAMSASGPLLAKVDFQEYYKVVEDSLRSQHSNKCVIAVKDGFKEIDISLKQKIGQKNLNLLFKLCDPIDEYVSNSNDISNFYEIIASNFAGVVQYNKDNRIANENVKNITINELCDIMVNESLGTPVSRLAKVNSLLLYTYNNTCTDYKYEKMINTMRNISWNSLVSEGGRQWTYQTCTEFGFYQTSSQTEHIFSNRFNVDFFIKQCKDIFGDNYNREFLNSVVKRTNEFYGGLNIKVTNVVFVHGSIDPWHALGITRSSNPYAPAIYINGTAHCANMYPISDNDLPQLKLARGFISQIISNWLNQ